MPSLVFVFEHNIWWPKVLHDDNIIGFINPAFEFKHLSTYGNIAFIEESCCGYKRVHFVDYNRPSMNFRFPELVHHYEVGEYLAYPPEAYNQFMASKLVVLFGKLHINSYPSLLITQANLARQNAERIGQAAQAALDLKDREIAELKQALAQLPLTPQVAAPAPQEIQPKAEKKPKPTKSPEEIYSEQKIKIQQLADQYQQNFLEFCTRLKQFPQKQLQSLVLELIIPLKNCEEILKKFHKDKKLAEKLAAVFLSKMDTYSDIEILQCLVPQQIITMASLYSDNDTKVRIIARYQKKTLPNIKPVIVEPAKQIDEPRAKTAPLKPAKQLSLAINANNADAVNMILADHKDLVTVTIEYLLNTQTSVALFCTFMIHIVQLDDLSYFKLNQTHKFIAMLDAHSEVMREKIQSKDVASRLWYDAKAKELYAVLRSGNKLQKPDMELLPDFVEWHDARSEYGMETILMLALRRGYGFKLISNLIAKSKASLLLRDKQNRNIFFYLTSYLTEDYLLLIRPLCSKYEEHAEHTKISLLPNVDAQEYETGKTFIMQLLEHKDERLVLNFLKELFAYKPATSNSAIFRSTIYLKDTEDYSVAIVLDRKPVSWLPIRKILYAEMLKPALFIAMDPILADIYLEAKSGFFMYKLCDTAFELVQKQRFADLLEVLESRYQMHLDTTTMYDKEMKRSPTKAKKAAQQKIVGFFKRPALHLVKYGDYTVYGALSNQAVADGNAAFEKKYSLSGFYKDVLQDLSPSETIVAAKVRYAYKSANGTKLQTDVALEYVRLLRTKAEYVTAAMFDAVIANSCEYLEFITDNIKDNIEHVITKKFLACAIAYAAEPNPDSPVLKRIFNEYNSHRKIIPNSDEFKDLSNTLFMQAVINGKSVAKTFWLIHRGYDPSAVSPIDQRNILQELFDSAHKDLGWISLSNIRDLTEALFFRPEYVPAIIYGFVGGNSIFVFSTCAALHRKSENSDQYINQIFSLLLDNGAKFSDADTMDAVALLQDILDPKIYTRLVAVYNSNTQEKASCPSLLG